MLVDPLGGHVVRGAHQGVGCGRFGAKEPAQPEVAQFNDAFSGNEDIGGLNICFKQKVDIMIFSNDDRLAAAPSSGENCWSRRQ